MQIPAELAGCQCDHCGVKVPVRHRVTGLRYGSQHAMILVTQQYGWCEHCQAIGPMEFFGQTFTEVQQQTKHLSNQLQQLRGWRGLFGFWSKSFRQQRRSITIQLTHNLVWQEVLQASTAAPAGRLQHCLCCFRPGAVPLTEAGIHASLDDSGWAHHDCGGTLRPDLTAVPAKAYTPDVADFLRVDGTLYVDIPSHPCRRIPS